MGLKEVFAYLGQDIFGRLLAADFGGKVIEIAASQTNFFQGRQ
jgi:hypothetical protein